MFNGEDFSMEAVGEAYDRGTLCRSRDRSSPYGSFRRREVTYSWVSGTFVSQTDKAICIGLNDKHEWFPKSQIKMLKIDGGIAGFQAPDWLLTKKQQENVIVDAKCDAIKTDIPEARKPHDYQWAVCDECKNDSFNIARFKGKYFLQCASCGKQLELS